MKKYLYIILILSLPILLISAGKNDFLGMLQKQLNVYNKKMPREKIYIQTDKTYYKPSESIWYKAFLTNANDNKPSATSDVIYVELHDPWGNVIQKHEHNLMEGTCDSQFKLGEDVPGGLYKIVAYTNWIKNWGKDVFFSKEITVQKVITPRLLLKLDFEKRAYGAGDEVVANLKVTDLDNVKTNNSIVKSTVRINGIAVQVLENKTENGEAAIKFNLPQDLKTVDGILQIVVSDRGTEESITRSIPIVLDKITIMFYPEGGDIVEGATAKVAFEALNEFKKGADVSGNIVDESNNIITTFESYHLGMGAFTFTPQANKKYYAKITKPQGNNRLIALPEILKTGYTLQLASKDVDKLKWNIYSPEDKTDISLIGQTLGEIYYSKQLRLKKGLNTVEVPTSDFPIGIAIFTLFNEQNEETCERLVFINADKGLNIEIETKEVYRPGETATIYLKTTDKDGKPIAANLGVSVVDEQLLTMADDKQDNILSYMLFSSELKGKIQEPNFYFDPTEPKAKEAIDYLMLTHGWRRFAWSEILNPSTREIKEFPEKLSSIYGYTLDKKGKPVQTDVYLIETEGKRRIGKVKTTPEGHFAFHNIDITGDLFFTTKLPNQVYLFKGKPIIAQKNKNVTGSSNENAEIKQSVTTPKGEVDMANSNFPIVKEREILYPNDFENASQLDEVVVMGYGVRKKSSLSGSVTVIKEQRDIVMLGPLSSALQGRVAGLEIDSRNINPGATQSITIRGVSSTMSGREPLVIINGIPVSEAYSSASSFVNPNNIQSITVLKNASATAIYGSRAANGVIIIETKSARFGERMKHGKPKYSSALSRKRQFYQSNSFNQDTDNKKQDNSTVYWNGNVKTNKDDGTAILKFNNNLQSSTFRISVEGIAGRSGLIGMNTKRIVTRKPFSLDTKIPLFAGVGDLIKVPVMVRNNTNEALSANISMNLDINLHFDGENNTIQNIYTKNITVAPNESQTVYFTIRAGSNSGISNIFINGNSRISNISINEDMNEYSDRIERKLTVRQINFPYERSISGNDMGQAWDFNLPDYVTGTLQAEAGSYPAMLDQLFDGVESIFREPYGCFEQLSSATFPNIFALQLLKATSQNNPNAESKALKYMESGYKKLAAYEVKGGGFEWYGGTPAHEVLSAYGLVEFYEMNKVYDKVDKAMMDRTREFILKRRNGKGGFLQNRGKYGFSAAPINVNNAYIVFALSETEYTKGIDEEYQSALNEAAESKDLYRMALMANAAYNMGDKESFRKFIEHFKEFATKQDLEKIKVASTIVRSYGSGSQRETVAFWLLALLKNKESLDIPLIEKCIQFINAGRQRGSFGSTQTTSICLQALTRYAELMQADKIEGSFCIDVNGDPTCVTITKSSKIRIPFATKLKKGQNTVKVKYENVEKPFPYAVNVSWQSKVPATSNLCPLKLTTELTNKTVKVNETVRLSVKLENTKKEGKPMSVAIIGIPGGMSLQPWQLKELQEKGVYDFYEIIKDNLIIYYRELGPSEVKTINLDLKAEVPGRYTGIASSAYVYYMNEHKYWIEGLNVTIKE